MDEREYLGSLLMASPEPAPAEKALPRDEHGFPYQVILVLHPGGHGTKDLKRDDEGRILGWEVSAEGKPGPGMRPVPIEVAEAAEKWLEELSAGSEAARVAACTCCSRTACPVTVTRRRSSSGR